MLLVLEVKVSTKRETDASMSTGSGHLIQKKTRLGFQLLLPPHPPNNASYDGKT